MSKQSQRQKNISVAVSGPHTHQCQAPPDHGAPAESHDLVCRLHTCLYLRIREVKRSEFLDLSLCCFNLASFVACERVGEGQDVLAEDIISMAGRGLAQHVQGPGFKSSAQGEKTKKDT